MLRSLNFPYFVFVFRFSFFFSLNFFLCCFSTRLHIKYCTQFSSLLYSSLCFFAHRNIIIKIIFSSRITNQLKSEKEQQNTHTHRTKNSTLTTTDGGIEVYFFLTFFFIIKNNNKLFINFVHIMSFHRKLIFVFVFKLICLNVTPD